MEFPERVLLGERFALDRHSCPMRVGSAFHCCRRLLAGGARPAKYRGGIATTGMLRQSSAAAGAARKQAIVKGRSWPACGRLQLVLVVDLTGMRTDVAERLAAVSRRFDLHAGDRSFGHRMSRHVQFREVCPGQFTMAFPGRQFELRAADPAEVTDGFAWLY